MKKIIAISTIALVTGLLYRPISLFHKFYLTPCPSDGPTVQDGFDLHYEEIDIEEYNNTLRNFSGTYDVSVAGKIEYNDGDYSIYQLEKRSKGKNKNLLIFAATHGDEFASALAIPQILDNIANDTLYDDRNVRVVTPINPVGLVNQSRYNKDGCDINRDFKEFRTLGAQIQKNSIDEFNPTVVVSLHEGPQEDFFIIGTVSTPGALKEKVVIDLSNAGVDLATRSFLGLNLSNNGIMHEGWLITNAKRWFGIYTLGRYAESQGSFTITTESSWMEKDIQKRIDPHIHTIESIITYFNNL